jgi:hypothetical protein
MARLIRVVAELVALCLGEHANLAAGLHLEATERQRSALAAAAGERLTRHGVDEREFHLQRVVTSGVEEDGAGGGRREAEPIVILLIEDGAVDRVPASKSPSGAGESYDELPSISASKL